MHGSSVAHFSVQGSGRVEKCDEQKDYVRKAMARVDENQKRKQTPTPSAPLGLQT